MFGRQSSTSQMYFFTRSLTAEEFLYLNQWNEIALLSVGNLSERILMSNTTYVSIIVLALPLVILIVIHCWSFIVM